MRWYHTIHRVSNSLESHSITKICRTHKNKDNPQTSPGGSTLVARRFITEPRKLGRKWCIAWWHTHDHQAVSGQKRRNHETQRNSNEISCNWSNYHTIYQTRIKTCKDNSPYLDFLAPIEILALLSHTFFLLLLRTNTISCSLLSPQTRTSPLTHQTLSALFQPIFLSFSLHSYFNYFN